LALAENKRSRWLFPGCRPGFGSGANGITVNSDASVRLLDSVVRNFIGDGINFVPSVMAALSVSNAVVSDNAGHGIVMRPSGTSIYDGVSTAVKAFRNSTGGIALVGDVVTAGEQSLCCRV
jgi:hypothetical protein